MTCSKLTTFSLILAAASLSACSTVKMPNLDILKSLGFEEDAEDLGEYPSIADTPNTPTDVRSAELWDTEAKKLIKERDAFKTAKSTINESAKSDAELVRDAASLRAKVHAYKADDP